jgi:hypothetical protein
MNKKYIPMLLLTIVFLLIGGGITYYLYTDWKAEKLTVNEPAINLIKESKDEVDLPSIIHEAEKSVIQIEAHNETQTITGSGFLYNNQGDIITNAHVIKDTDAIYVRTSNARFYPAAVIGVSEETDIALLRVPQLANQDTLPLSENPVEIGDEVIALGSPHGFQNTVTLGIISGADRNIEVDGYTYSNAYQISAPITHGNSGGPLLRRETGEIIGINSVGTEDGMIGFSIPIEEIIDEVKEWSKAADNEDLSFASITDIVSNMDEEQTLDDAIYLSQYFWDNIGIRDYLSAYSLLSSEIQQSNSYAEFRDQYIHLIDVKVTNITSQMLEGNQVESIVHVDLIERDDDQLGEEVTSKTYTFHFSFENDQLKITGIGEQEA